MKPATLIACFVVSAVSAFAKDNPRITIQVVGTDTSTRQFTYYVPRPNGHSETNCDGNGASSVAEAQENQSATPQSQFE